MKRTSGCCLRNACSIETALLSIPFAIPFVAIALLLPEGVGELQKAVHGCNRSQAPCYIVSVQLRKNKVRFRRAMHLSGQLGMLTTILRSLAVCLPDSAFSLGPTWIIAAKGATVMFAA